MNKDTNIKNTYENSHNDDYLLVFDKGVGYHAEDYALEKELNKIFDDRYWESIWKLNEEINNYEVKVVKQENINKFEEYLEFTGYGLVK